MKLFRKFFFILAVLTSVFALVSCSDDDDSETASETYTFGTDTVTIYSDGTTTIKAEDGTTTQGTYTIENGTITIKNSDGTTAYTASVSTDGSLDTSTVKDSNGSTVEAKKTDSDTPTSDPTKNPTDNPDDNPTNDTTDLTGTYWVSVETEDGSTVEGGEYYYFKGATEAEYYYYLTAEEVDEGETEGYFLDNKRHTYKIDGSTIILTQYESWEENGETKTDEYGETGTYSGTQFVIKETKDEGTEYENTYYYTYKKVSSKPEKPTTTSN